MSDKPIALDLFCGSGGVGIGLARAGFDVLGVDIEPQPNYPFPFLQADAFKVLATLCRGDHVWFEVEKRSATRRVARNLFLSHLSLIWASPPCQGDSVMQHAHNAQPHPSFIRKTRRDLQKTGKPWVIENVVGAPLLNPIMLCGSHFGLGARGYHLQRHRLFEATFPIEQPQCNHQKPVVGVYGGHVRLRAKSAGGRGTADFPHIKDKPGFMAEVMGIDRLMTMSEMSQAIPPAYAEHVGRAALAHIAHKSEAA
jgi:DNA (cytosine-5)-methyltransferase 1